MELVEMREGQPMTTSRLIAMKFNKQHSHILRGIESLECSTDFSRSNFGLTSYTDTFNRSQKEYLITKDGFSFLVMGFTGKRAAKFKEDYIKAFNEALKPKSFELRVMDIMKELHDKVR